MAIRHLGRLKQDCRNGRYVVQFPSHQTARGGRSALDVLFGNHRARNLATMPTGLRYDDARAEYNDAARRAARQTGVRYCDMAEIIAAAGLDCMDVVSEDGVHLSPLGLGTYTQIAASEITGIMTVGMRKEDGRCPRAGGRIKQKES